MATATADSYTAASGAAVYAGRGPVVPAWRLSMSPLTSAQIGSNSLADVDPAQDVAINPMYASRPDAPWITPTGSNINDLISAYSGGSYNDATGVFWVAGGGHGGWNGNCAFSVDLMQSSPTWARRGYPTGSIQHPLPGGQDRVNYNGSQDTVYEDRPHSVHSYNLLAATPDGDLWLLPGGFNWNVAWFRRAFRFIGASNDWDTTNIPSGEGILGPTSGPILGQVGASCYDPVRNCIWQITVNDCIVKWPAPASYGVPTYTYYSSGGFASQWGMVYDTTRNWVYIFANDTTSDGQSGRCVACFDASAGTTTPTWLNIPSASTSWCDAGIAYDSIRDRILIWEGGLTLTTLTPPASPLSSAWATGSITLTGADPGVEQAAGTYGRFAFSARLNAALIVNDADTRMHAFALEAA